MNEADSLLVVDVILYVMGLIITILIMRVVGPWMLRINDVIEHQKAILEELRKTNSKP